MGEDNLKPMPSKSDSFLMKLVKMAYAIVLFGAAALIITLFEQIVPVNIYLVYLTVGVILGFAVIILLHLFAKKDKE